MLGSGRLLRLPRISYEWRPAIWTQLSRKDQGQFSRNIICINSLLARNRPCSRRLWSVLSRPLSAVVEGTAESQEGRVVESYMHEEQVLDQPMSRTLTLMTKIRSENSSSVSKPLIDDSLSQLAQVLRETEKVSDIHFLQCLESLQDLSDASHPAVVDVLSALLDKWETDAFSHVLDSADICRGFYYLRNKSDNSKSVRCIIGIFSERIGSRVATPQQLCEALHGLRNCRSMHIEVRNAVAGISKQLNESLLLTPMSILPLSSICDALFCLQLMKSDVDEVSILLKVLTESLYQSRDAPSSNSIARALFGLQSMNNASQEVEAALGILTLRLVECPVSTISPADVAKCMYGLKSMRLKRDVKFILGRLAEIIKSIRLNDGGSVFSYEDMEMILYGMKNMSDDCKEVRAIVSEVAVLLSDMCSGSNGVPSCSPGQVSNMLHALKSMNHNSMEVCALLVSIEKLLDKNSKKFKAREAIRALIGLKNMSMNQKEVKSLILSIRRNFFPFDFDSAHSNRQIVNMMYNVKNIFSCPDDEVRKLFIDLCGMIRTSPDCGDTWDLRLFCKLMYCMSSFTAESSEIVAAVGRLLPDQVTPTNLQIINIANASVGLQGLSAHLPEVRKIISTLAVALCDIMASGHGAGSSAHCLVNMFRGINNKTTENVEIKRFLAALGNPVLWGNSGSFSAQDCSQCYFSIRSMDSATIEVQRLLAELLSKTRASVKAGGWGMPDVVRCLCGIRQMGAQNNDFSELLSLFGGVLNAPAVVRGPVDAADILQAITALTDTNDILEYGDPARRLLVSLFAVASTNRLRPAVWKEPPTLCEVAVLLHASRYADKKNYPYRLLADLVNRVDQLSATADYIDNNCAASIVSSIRELGLRNETNRSVKRLFTLLTSAVSDPGFDISPPFLLKIIADMATLQTGSVAYVKFMNLLLDRLNGHNQSGRDVIILLQNLKGLPAEWVGVQLVLCAVLAQAPTVDMSLVPSVQLCRAISGLSKMNIDVTNVPALLLFLSKAINDSASAFSAKDIAEALRGVQHMTAGDIQGALMVISALADKIISTGDNVYLPDDISRCFQAIKNFGSREAVVKLIANLGPLIRNLEIEFDSKNIYMTIDGLSGMSDREATVRMVLGALTARVSAPHCQISVKYLLKYLYCLRSMHHGSEEAKEFAIAVTNRLSSYMPQGSSKDLCSAIFGLQGVANDPALGPLLTHLERSILAYRGEYSTSSIGAALYGLSQMNISAIPAVVPMIELLSDKLLTSAGHVSALDAQHLVISLRNVAKSRVKANALAGNLSCKLNETPLFDLDSKTIGMCMKAIMVLDDTSPEVKSLIMNLARIIQKGKEPQQSNAALRASSCMIAIRAETAENNELISVLSEKIAASSGHYVVEDVLKAIEATRAMSGKAGSSQMLKFAHVVAEKAVPFESEIRRRVVDIPPIVESCILSFKS